MGKEAGAFKQGKLIMLSREMIANGRVPGNVMVRRKDFRVKTGEIGVYMCFHFSRNIILAITQGPSALPSCTVLSRTLVVISNAAPVFTN